MRIPLVLLLAFCCVPAWVYSQQDVVIPAVSDNVSGINDSLWVTEVQIIKMDPFASLSVRRVWVCTESGGFLEDPGTALEWDMTHTSPGARILTLTGEDLLEGSGAVLGAVALEISGGEAIVNARVADVFRGTQVWATPFGQGQRIPTNTSPLEGFSHISWIGGCFNAPCNLQPPVFWDYFRNNIGFVNPNSAPITITGTAIPFGYDPGDTPAELELVEPNETFTKTIPPFGWTQFSWKASQQYGYSIWEVPLVAQAGFVISLSPDSEAPYYAYASTVFAPDPESGVPAFNDPMFIPAQPGLVEPFKRDLP